jgi:thioredoxin-like negative regulator of GroEL
MREVPRRLASLAVLGTALACAPLRPRAGLDAEAAAPRPASIAAEPVPAPVPRSDLAAREAGIDDRLRDAAAGSARAVPSGDALDDLLSVRILERDGPRDRARLALHAARRAHPADPLIALHAARVALEDGDGATAAALLADLEARGVEHPALRLLLGQALLADDRPEAGERLLREELAAGPGFGAAALALCDGLTAAERFEDALAVLAAARRRDPVRADLRLVEARLLHDTWQLGAAAAALEALLAESPELAVVRVQLAEVERARGDLDRGRALLDGVPAGDPWAAGQGRRLAELREDLRGQRPTLPPSDLLAMVRGAEPLAVRLRAFDALAAVPETRDAAIRAGFAQPEVGLRVRAVRAFPVDEPGFADDLAVAIRDPDGRVRGTALRRTAEIGDPILGPRLARDALLAEEDPYAFRAAHEALTARLGPRVVLPPGAERDPAVRRQTREAWRSVCPE